MNDKGKPSGSNGGNGDQQLTVGDKTYTVQDVENLLSQSKANNEAVTQASKVINAAKTYNLSTDDFLDQAIGGLTVINNLIQSGVIDNEGTPIKKTPEKPAPADGSTGNPELDKLLGTNVAEPDPSKSSKTESIVMKALGSIGEKMENLGKRLEGVSDVQTSIIRDNFETKLKVRFPGLTDEMVSRVFVNAANDKSKNIWDHAAALVETSNANRVEVEKAFAEKHKLNYEELTKQPDPNDLLEPGAEGGAGPLKPGKKISFRPNRNEEETVSPLDAAQDFYKKKDLESKGGI